MWTLYLPSLRDVVLGGGTRTAKKTDHSPLRLGRWKCPGTDAGRVREAEEILLKGNAKMEMGQGLQCNLSTL